MDPSVWGACIWRSIHLIALGYAERPTDEDKQVYTNYFTELWTVLPCFKCSVNYKRHIQELPITSYLSSKKKLFEWTVKLHNIVNKELNKREISIEEAYAIHLHNKKANQVEKYIVIIGVFAIVMTVFFIFGKKKIL